jgi:hypothetical protein
MSDRSIPTDARGDDWAASAAVWTLPATGATRLSLWPAAARMAMLYGPWVVVLALPQTLAVGFDLMAPVLGLEWVPWPQSW